MSTTEHGITVTLTEAEWDKVCDALVDYTAKRAVPPAERAERWVRPRIERIVAARVAEALAPIEALWDNPPAMVTLTPEAADMRDRFLALLTAALPSPEPTP